MLKRKFNLIILFISLFCIGFTVDVFAANFTYADTDYSIYYDNYTAGVSDDGSYLFRYSDFTEWSGWTDKNVATGAYDGVTGEYTVLGRIGFRWYGNSTNYFEKNNLYNINMELRFGTKEARQLFYDNYVLFYARANTSASQDGNSIKYLDTDIRYTMTLDPDSNGTIFINIKFIPNTDVKFVRFDFINKNLNPIEDTSLSTRLDTLVFGRIRYYDSTITYTEDTGALIENQTDVIIEQTNKLNQSIEELMDVFRTGNDDTLNADAESSFTGNSDKFDNFNETETGLKNSVDVDISSLVFDSHTYESSFGFVWDNVTSFINSNIKVFRMVIAVLTLSFVGLVIGRL